MGERVEEGDQTEDHRVGTRMTREELGGDSKAAELKVGEFIFQIYFSFILKPFSMVSNSQTIEHMILQVNLNRFLKRIIIVK